MRSELALCLTVATLVCGGAGPAEPDVGARRDELARVTEALSDPDPMQRLANMEAIVKASDPIKTNVAMRIALASDDADLRALAMRAYFATRHEINFDILLPANVQHEYDNEQDDPRLKRQLLAEHRYIPSLERAGFKMHLEIARYTFPEDTGEIAIPNRQTAPFAIKGDAFSSYATVYLIGTCTIDFAPKPDRTLQGTIACQGGWPKLQITARML